MYASPTFGPSLLADLLEILADVGDVLEATPPKMEK